MRSYTPFLRPLALAALAIAVLGGGTGCKWFRKGNPDYAMSAETRPLEVPPDLNLPNTAGAMKLPPTGAPTTPQGVASSATGFNVAGQRDEVFAKVGEALAGVEGLTIASRAQLLGSYDVAYEGSNFLVRVVAVDAGAYVSAVDPRGLPAAGSAPKLMAALKAKLGG
ncbi:MAG: hypothetical protein ABWY94_06325 [Pseudoxanthomonas sp.]